MMLEFGGGGSSHAMILPQLLRHTRINRELSQMDLALRLNVSCRHVSFVESGRARPSRELLLAWLREVRAPASVRNAALLNAGYASAQSESGLNCAQLAASRAVLRQMMQAHNPFPGLVFDADWMMLDLNEGGQWLCSLLMPELWEIVAVRDRGMDMIRTLAHPLGLLSRMRNAKHAGMALLHQLRAEQWTRPALKPRIDELAEALDARYGAPTAHEVRAPDNPHLNLEFDTEYGIMSFLTVQSVFALPQDVTVASLRVEMWFPANPATRDILLRHTPA